MASATELAFCIAGIYGCFLTWGVLQERVSTTPYYSTDSTQPVYFQHFVFLNTIQSLCACLVAYLYLKLRGLQMIWPTADLSFQFFIVAFCGSIASLFGYESLKHVDYPTMILAKSCKLVPVMLMSFILHRRTFEWYKYLSVAFITTGVCAFMLYHPQKRRDEKQSSLWGLLLLTINMLIDGATNSTQDHIFIKYRINGPQMMFFMNLYSFLIMLSYLGLGTWILFGQSELLAAIQFSAAYPQSIFDVFLFGFFGSIGQVFIFHTLERFGSLILVTVNVTRKMFSMLLSVVWFGHVLNLKQWVSVGLVFGGIGLEAQMSRLAKIQKQKSTDDDVQLDTKKQK